MNFRARLAAVALLALAVRGAYILSHSRGEGELVGDAHQYHHFAVNLVEKSSYEDAFGDRLFRIPGYPVFLAGIYAVGGPRVAAVQLVQAVLGALACLCLFLTARKLWGEPWDLLCGGGAAFYLGLIEPCARVLSESLGSSLAAYFLWAWFCLEGGAAVRAGVSALLLAALSLVRPDFGPSAAALALASPRLDPQMRGRHVLIWVAAAFLVFSPWIIRNQRVFGRFIPGSTQGEAGIYYGLAFQLEALGDLGKVEYLPTGVPELEQRQYYLKEFRALWAAMPALKIARAYAFNIASVFYPFLPAYDWTYAFWVPFWLWACWRLRGRPVTKAALCLILPYLAVHLVTGGPVSRYREPIAGALLLLGVSGLRDLAQRWEGGFQKRVNLWLGFNFLAYLFSPTFRSAALTLKRIVLC